MGAPLHRSIPLSLALPLLALLISGPNGAEARLRKVQVQYPVALLPPIAGSYFEAEVSKDLLTCFSNRDFPAPSFLRTLTCLLAVNNECTNVWGSRRIWVEAKGSVEFLLTHALPPEGRDTQSLNVTRWLQITDKREVKEVPAEPMFLCARSNNWQRDRPTSSFVIKFHPAHIRHKDRLDTITTVFLHILLFPVITSPWLLPLFAASVMAFIAFQHGLKVFIIILVSSSLMLLTLPFLFRKRNRQVARKLFLSMFSRVQAEEAKQAIRQKLPVFQALTLSCLIICVGSGSAHVACEYFGLHWESRNHVIQLSMALAAGWLSFFLCRSFDRFCKDWVWVGMSYGLAKIVDRRLNPACHDELLLGAMAISITLWAALPRLFGYLRHSKLLLVVFPMAPSVAGFLRLRREKSLNQLLAVDESDRAAAAVAALATQESVEDEVSQYETEELDSFLVGDADSSKQRRPSRPPSKVNLKPSKSVMSTTSWFSAAADATSEAAEEMSKVDSAVVLANRTRLEETLGVPLKKLPSGVDLRAQGESSILGTDGLQFQDISMAPATEGMLGVLPLPVYVKGPLLIDGVVVHVPLATYDGSVVDFFQRGALAMAAVGVKSQVSNNAFAQWSTVSFGSFERAEAFHAWLSDVKHVQLLQGVFRGEEAFAGELRAVHSQVLGQKVYIRTEFDMGDAPVVADAAAAVERILLALAEHFDDMQVVSLCSVAAADDNNVAMLRREQGLWQANGAAVTVEVRLDSRVVERELGCSVANFIAASKMYAIDDHNPLDPLKACLQRTVTAFFLATGQDPAVASNSARTLVRVEAVAPSATSIEEDVLPGAEEETGGLLASLSGVNQVAEAVAPDNDLLITLTLPSVVAGPLAAGAALGPAAVCLNLLKLEELVRDSRAGSSSESMARVVAASVLASYIGWVAEFAQSTLVTARTGSSGIINLL